jgi:hypothetical protein
MVETNSSGNSLEENGTTGAANETQQPDRERGGRRSDRRATSGRGNGLEAAHGLSTDGADKGLEGSGGRQDQVGGGVLIRVRPVEQEAQGSQAKVMGVGKEAEVAHLHKALWEDVLQETVDELIGGESAEFELAGVGRAIAEGDLVVLKLDEAAVGEGDAEDVRGQVFEGRASIANRLAVHYPVLFPRKGRDLRPNRGGDGGGERRFLEGVEELGSKDPGESFHRE